MCLRGFQTFPPIRSRWNAEPGASVVTLFYGRNYLCTVVSLNGLSVLITFSLV
jgi:hypothetical protein